MKAPACLLLLLALAILAPAASAQGRVTIANGTLTLQNSGQLATTGHLTVSGTLTIDAGTTLRFNGPGNQHFTPTADQALHHLTIDKPTGDLVLMGSLTVTGALTLIQGDLDLNGFAIDLRSTGTLSEPDGHTVKGTAGTISATRTLDQPTDDNVAGLGARITSSANLGETIITRGHTIQSDGGSQGIARYFDIAPATNTGLNATLAFSYDESELNGHAELDLRLFRSTDGGTVWSEEGGIPDAQNNTVALAGIDAFSRWTLAGTGLLPVELVAFEAQVDGSDVLLAWQTASETNNAGFDIQHANGSGTTLPQDWQVLGFVEGHGTTLEEQAYRYRVTALHPGRHVFRLKQIDFDGAFDYSPAVAVFVELTRAYLLTPPYPNPFHPEARFSLMVKQSQQVEVAIYDALGRRVRVVYRGMLAAEQAQRLVFEAGDLPSGLYLIRAVGEHFAATRRVMLLR